MDATAYIAEQVPLLQALHEQLALPPSALVEDTARIDAAVRAAIASVVRSREDEVARWEASIADGKLALSGIARALGEQGRMVAQAMRRDSEKQDPLPVQHQRLIQQTEELELVYNERLAKVNELLSAIETLSVILGPGFDPAPPLEPVPGCSAVPARSLPVPSAPIPGKRTSRAVTPTPAPEPKAEVWYDVGEEVLEQLQGMLDKAMVERDARLVSLETHFNDLMWYHAELRLPPLPGDTDRDFPTHLLPPRDQEEQPGAHARYERTLVRIMAANPTPMPDDEEGEGSEIQGMDGVEPEIGLLTWAEALIELWSNEKDKRDAQIQRLFEQIEPLWTRLEEITPDYMDRFVEMNQGSGEGTIQAYEAELERVREIRKSSLSQLVVAVRREIALLQDSLMMGDDEKGAFGAFIDDEYTEELLQIHEDEATRLRAEVEIMGPLLERAKEWLQLKEEEEELERSAADPNRFKKRGTVMLREEKMRKRVERRKPKVEAELLTTLPAWEDANGRPFLANGQRVVDMIEGALAAKEAAKEAKKLAKLGLAPGGPSRPGPSGTRSAPGTAMGRKRPVETPAMGMKRARVGTGTRTGSRTGQSTTGNMGVSTMSTTSTMSTGMASVASTSRAPRFDPFATPTAMAASRRFGAPGGARANVRAHVPATSSRPVQATPQFKGLKNLKIRGNTTSTLQFHTSLQAHAALDDVQRADKHEPHSRRPRKSFRPRLSVAGGLLMAGDVECVAEEDEDVF